MRYRVCFYYSRIVFSQVKFQVRIAAPSRCDIERALSIVEYFLSVCVFYQTKHYICPMENIGITIPAGTRKEDIKAREKIIKDFYAKWISEHPDKKIWNENLQDYICVKYQSINETYNKAARRYESTLAVFRLTEVMEKAILKEETKPGDKNQKPYSKLLIMLHDDIKLTVGVQKSTQEKVQYCLTALGSTSVSK